ADDSTKSQRSRGSDRVSRDFVQSLALDQYLRSITSGFQPTPPTHCRHEQIFILLASALIAGVAALFASAAAGLHLEGAHYLA
ncbi:hypothetical protein CXG50_27455, partial [Pseudomonas plecoglossicida]